MLNFSICASNSIFLFGGLCLPITRFFKSMFIMIIIFYTRTPTNTPKYTAKSDEKSSILPQQLRANSNRIELEFCPISDLSQSELRILVLTTIVFISMELMFEHQPKTFHVEQMRPTKQIWEWKTYQSDVFPLHGWFALKIELHTSAINMKMHLWRIMKLIWEEKKMQRMFMEKHRTRQN